MIYRGCIVVSLVALTLLGASLVSATATPEEEAAVQRLLQKYVDRDRNMDVDGLLACYAPDAKIDSIAARGKVTKGTYASAMRQAQAQGRLGSNHEAKIRSLIFRNADQAILEFDYGFDVPREGRRNTTMKWTVVKRDGEWLISETEYLKK